MLYMKTIFKLTLPAIALFLFVYSCSKDESGPDHVDPEPELTFTVEDLDGNILMTRLMRPGETYVVPKINGLTFNTGNAGALSLSQGDVVVTKLGEIGEIITARPLNIKAFSKPTLIVE